MFIAAEAAERSKPMKTRPIIIKLLTALLTLCIVLSLAPILVFAAEDAASAQKGAMDVTRGSDVTVKTTIRNNYTDTRTDETVTYVNGIALVDGDQSDLNGNILTFIDLGDLTIQAAYDSANNKTTLTLDIRGIQQQTEEQQYFTEYRENKSRMTTTYDGSQLTYNSTSKDPVTGKVTINEILRDDYYIRNHVYERACLIIPATESITSAAVQGVNFNYQPGDAPQATAEVYNADADKYEIVYECWQEFEGNEPVAAWYSDNGSHGSLQTIKEFESGKKYVYFLMLKPKDGYSFRKDTVMTVNGESVKTNLSGAFLYVPSVKTITMPTVKVIDVVEINNVTVSFKDGDKPVFTGKIPDGANYNYDCEWWELDSKTGAISSESFSGAYENKITAFEAGKTYHYGVYVKAAGFVESENTTYVFGSDTKLKINGEFVNYKRYEGDMGDGSDSTMWVLTDLAMIPEAGGTTSSEKYTVTYTDGVDGEEIFKDQTYTVEAGKATPAFNGTPARKGYTFAGWKPAVAATVTGDATYEATWKPDSAKTTPDDTKPKTGETTSPKTGDASNILLWIALLFVSGGTAIGTTVVDRKKKYNR